MENLFQSNDLSRRVFIKGLGFVSVGLVMGIMGGCDQLAEAIKNRPTRRRLRTGSPEVDADIATYKQAVTLMKGLPAADPRSWDNQAKIHGEDGHFNFCQHGTSHFFDWHRAYLLYFERICQKLTGNSKFGLPYWNWNQDPDIHPAFLDPTSVLFLARNRTSMSGNPAVSTADLDPIFADTNFFTFWQQIEVTPHNNVHTFIGGTMGTGGSALDPIFWMHHCMVDYCWAKWNLELNNNNTNDPTWINTVDSHFVDENQNPVSDTAGITTLMPLLSYQYESSAIGSSPAAAAITTKSAYVKLEKRIREGADIRFDIKQRIPIAERQGVSIARPFSKETRLSPADLATIINNDASKERVFVSIEYAKLPPASDFSVRVFVDLPNANSATPTEDPHYAGSFAFFGTESPGETPTSTATATPAPSPTASRTAAPAASPTASRTAAPTASPTASRTAAPTASPTPTGAPHEHEQPRFLVNITNTLQRLRQRQELKEGSPISVQLVAVPFAGKFERETTELQLEKIEIIITPVIINTQ